MRVVLISTAWMALAWMVTELVAVALPPAEATRQRPRQHLVPPASEGTMWSLAFPAAPAAGEATVSQAPRGA